ncbi:hypothetical protein PF010_g10406 [Phytophthora fragariae]|uniref:Uncharacterized protein n=1 Tax=Phytophthora fragariae TaxID=53985 RepID=A0A6G0N3P3_9STRA|nr:hypothetical protein PF010_g10406 [Phytophthora fragariae]KAE9192814.1 hypothetical protein PF004_g21195 [Phytophthora fragariae]
MASCAGREEEDREFWGDDSYGYDDEDALFGSPDGDQEPGHDDLFSLATPVQTGAVMQLDLVERLSWDATSDCSSDEEDEMKLTLPVPLSINVGGTEQGDAGLQWSLISPCSETGSVTPTLSPLTRVSLSSPVRMSFFELELEPSDEQVKTTEGSYDRQDIQEEDKQEEDDEEVHQFDPETCWCPDENNVLSLSSPAATTPANPFTTYQPPEPAEEDIDRSDAGAASSDSESDGENNAASALRPSLLPRVPSMARWRRQKARTCSGAGSAGMPTALSLATFRARTRSLSRSRNQSVVDDEDDGDFSSDDEGYTPELHCRRASETEPFGASQWRRARNSSMSFSSHRLSMNVSVSPAMMTKRLQEAKNKLGSGLNLLRSGSTSSTVMSDESFLDSPAFDEIKSAPARIHREPSIFSDEATCTSLISAASAYDVAGEQHPTRQHQLRAGVFKAAGIFNAASAKLKSRAGSFRPPHLPKQKTAASETEEEDPEMVTPQLPPVPAP